MTDEFTGQVIAEKYRVDPLLRNGELGDMYRGWNLFMDKPVTLKILPTSLAVDDGTRKQFSAEARNAVIISHPNILAVNDFAASSDGLAYIVFEGFEGEPLSDVLHRDGQMTPERAINITKQISSALAAANEKNVVHGKLAPDKILIASSPEGGDIVKVFDFNATGNYTETALDNNAVYMAPEQFSSKTKPDARTDVYSLGVIFYHLLTGTAPFNGETRTDIILKHTEEAPPPLSPFRKDMPAVIEPVVFKALAKDPDLRYQTPQAFADDLDLLAYSLSNSTAAPAGNNLWKTAFVVLAGIALLASALIYGTSVKQTNPITQLQPDANGQPVQPINPATGVEEQNLASMTGMMPEMMGNSNMMAQPPGTLPGGDNYNPWGNGGAPPPGAPLPTYVAPGGQVFTIDPNNPSQFMPPDGVILVPVPANTTTVKPTLTPRAPASNANVSANTALPKSTPEVKTPAKPAASPVKPADQPKATKPLTNERQFD